MPQLRILFLHGVDCTLFNCHLPCLAMLSWRCIAGPLLPFNLEALQSVAVLDIAGSDLERAPSNLKARAYFT